MEESCINHDMERYSVRMQMNGFSFTIVKTQVINFSRQEEVVVINGDNITTSREFKYLGVTIDANFTYDTHIDGAVRKLGKMISVISRLRHFGGRKVLLRYHNNYIKSALQYSILIYAGTSKNHLKPI